MPPAPLHAVRVPSRSIGLKRTPHPHDVQNVGVRGLLASDVLLALDLCGTQLGRRTLLRAPILLVTTIPAVLCFSVSESMSGNTSGN